jgi:hypothetical protein
MQCSRAEGFRGCILFCLHQKKGQYVHPKRFPDYWALHSEYSIRYDL